MIDLGLLRQIVCEAFGISEECFCGQGRPWHATRARMAFTWLARRHTTNSYPEIARAMKLVPDSANHSTPLTQLKRLARMFAGEIDSKDKLWQFLDELHGLDRYVDMLVSGGLLDRLDQRVRRLVA